MKKTASYILLTCLMTASVLFANAQKKFTEGKIVFDIAFPDMEMDQNQAAMMPSEATMYVKKGMSRMDMKMGSMGSMMAIYKNDSAITLMDMMGRKTAIRFGKQDADKMKGKMGKPEVKITDETKVIAGYKCTKAIVTVDISGVNENAKSPALKKEKGPHTFNVWYTKDIEAKNSMKSQIEGIEGFMLEFQMEDRGVSMKMTARSVEPQPVDDSMFAVPDGYKEMKMDDIMKMQGGGK